MSPIMIFNGAINRVLMERLKENADIKIKIRFETLENEMFFYIFTVHEIGSATLHN
jgi:hypothetical protein